MRRLSEGDVIVFVNPTGDFNLTYGEHYEVVYTRCAMSYSGVPMGYFVDDICIKDDDGGKHWFGQIGSTESWDNWFVLKDQWEREKNIDKLLNDE